MTFKLEPARLPALVAAVLALAMAFGLKLTLEQRDAILTFVAVVGPFIVGEVARANSIPTETVRRAGLNPDAVVNDARDPSVAPYTGGVS